MKDHLRAVPFSQQAAQLVFPAFHFGKHDPALAERLVDLGVGGFCLYRGGPREIWSFVQRLQRRARIPLLFAGDYEDGAASHVAGCTRLPSNMALGASGDAAFAYQKALITAIEARSLGVRWIFAPVLDLAIRADNPIVNVRSFGAAPALVSRMGRAYLEGLRGARALSCAKHFPGHGDTHQDSHLELPTIKAVLARLRARDLVPFSAAAGLADSVMLAHLSVPALGDARGLPVPFSPKAVRGLLRGRLGYEGLVVTDALDMKAVAGRFPELEASGRALSAGADILLVPSDPEALVRQIAERAAREPELIQQVYQSFRRLARAKRACGAILDRGLSPEQDLAHIGRDKHAQAARRMAAASMTWVRGPVRLRGRIRYLEPDAGPARWSGKAFVEALRGLGLEVAAYSRAGKGPVVAGAFLGPRAYSGRIALAAASARALSAALVGAQPGVLASFGSPFVLDEVRGWSAALCAFSSGPASQQAAARVLALGIPAPGRMPVRLARAPGGR